MLGAKTRRLRPVLTLDVVDNGAFFPSKQRGDHQPDAFASYGLARTPERVRARCAGGNGAAPTFRAPPAHVDPCAWLSEAGLRHIVIVGPSRGAMQVIGVLR